MTSAKTGQPSPPKHLSRRCKALWRRIHTDYVLEGHHSETLRVALEALDRATEAREALREAGPVFTDRFGQPRKNPWVSIEETARVQFFRGMRELDLDGEAPADIRPPRTRSYE